MIRALASGACAFALVIAAPAIAQAPANQSAAPGSADWRTPDPENVLVIDTTKGRILVEIVPQLAPLHAERIRVLTRQGLYDGRKFFRVIDGFMAQTGDPLESGEGGSELPDLPAEFTFRLAPAEMVKVHSDTVSEMGFVGPVPVRSQSSWMAAVSADGKAAAFGLFCPGVAGMARGSGADTANSQFFLMRAKYPSLEQRYTVWGRVISGLDVVRAIKTGEPVSPPQDEMTTVRVLADLSAAERPKVRVVDARSGWLAAEVARLKALKGPDFNACDVDLPVEVK
ncbi:MAG: peptidylprolyl isomerase [Phenylobacterium sp.]|jgi:peptidylprolyl isomerase|uniref:peptidylprolyl isomerase n=1 Tax=Phenylobacterium sp. TaxID=1871053 RepID=UPI002A335094|nr:peptidylprolyl isomerase [Phenylobacterium sp.]MDD3838322.1 peptidylprolyl isomerase [Phenylobacterium sp.]MDX9998141.1 peptidylprolyl isomerase [Phenylobacterium sp.]